MTSFHEKYWRYSLFTLIIVAGIVILLELRPYMGGVLGAATIYVLLRRQLYTLTHRYGWRRSIAASLLMTEAVLCFLVPLSLVAWLVVAKVQIVVQDPSMVEQPLLRLAEIIHTHTGYNVWQESNISTLVRALPQWGQWALGAIADFSVNIIVLLFVLYFMLIGGRRMEDYVARVLPFDALLTPHIMHEMLLVVRSNAIGLPILALAQGFVGYLGYWLFGAPSALFWGVVTCFASVIPVVGTALVWLPLALYLAMTGHWASGAGLFAFGCVVITQVDNVVRSLLQKKMADLHPMITIFGVIVGLSLFGFMGVIFGPLLLAMFSLCVDIFKQIYLDGVDEKDLFPPAAPLSEQSPHDR